MKRILILGSNIIGLYNAMKYYETDLVIDIIDNNSLVGGAGAVVVGTDTSALTFTTPTAAGTGSSAGTTNASNSSYANALANLQANRAFIIDFVKAYNDGAGPNGAMPAEQPVDTDWDKE